MTKAKAETKKVSEEKGVEEPKLSFEEQLVRNVNILKSDLKKAEINYHQLEGALNMAQVTLEEFKKTKNE